MTYSQKRRGPMLLSPEQKGCVEDHRVIERWRPKLRQTDAVVPYTALWHESHAKDTVGQQELDAFRHVGIKTLRVVRTMMSTRPSILTDGLGDMSVFLRPHSKPETARQ
jgi:hypothetical protein